MKRVLRQYPMLLIIITLANLLFFGSAAIAQEQMDWETAVSSSDLNDLAYNGINLSVVVGSNGTIRTSADGETWTTQKSGTKYTLNSVIWGGSQFVAVGDIYHVSIVDARIGGNETAFLLCQRKYFEYIGLTLVMRQ